MFKPKPLKPVVLAIGFKLFYSLEAIARGTLKRIYALKGIAVGNFRTPRVLGSTALVLFLIIPVASVYLLIAQPAVASAATSSTLNFQARLETSSGAIAPDGNYNVEFKLYNASSAGTLLWTEDHYNNASNGIRVANGYLTVNLGSITAFGSLNWNQQMWLTMNIGGTTTGVPTLDGEMSPRIQLTAVPYAFQAGALGNGTNQAVLDSSGNLTLQQASIISTSTGQLTLQSATTLIVQTAAGTASSAITIQTGNASAGATGNITIDNGTFTSGTPTINIGTTNARAVQIGNSTAATTVALQGGTSSNAVSVQAASGGTISIGTAAVAQTVAIGNSTGATAVTVQAGSGGISFQAATTVSSNFTVTNAGYVAFQKGTDFSTIGTTNNAAFGTGSLIRLTGASAQTITGIAAGANGQVLTLVNAASQAAIVQNLNAGSLAANQISTGTGSDMSIPAGASTTLVYDSGASLWRVIGSSAAVGGYVQLQTSTPGTQQSGSFNISGTGIAGSFDSVASGTLSLGTTNASTVNVATNASAHTIAIGNGAAVQGITIGSTNTTSSVLIQAGTGNLQIQTQGGTLGIGNNAVAQTLTIGNTTGATAVTIQSGTGALNLQTQGTGGVNIATNAVAQTVTIGNTTGASAITLQSGTGAINLQTQGTGGINIGTNAVAQTITIGNSTGATSVVINDGTGALNIGTNAVAHTISIGNATGATSVVVDCGTGSCNFGTTATAHTTTVGSTNTTSATTIQSGSGGISLTGATSVTGTNTFTSGTGSVSLQGATTISANLIVTNAGNVAFQKTASDFSTTGTSNNVNFGTGALVRLTGATAQTITGIAAGSNGQILTIVNAAANAAIVADQSTANGALSTAANRISTGTGGDITVPAGASVYLVYDTGSSLWRIVNSVAATGGYVQLQGTTPGTAQTGNFNIGTGTGIAGTFDSIASGTLNLGTTNAATVNLATNAAAHTIAIGNGAAVQGITVGSTNTTSSVLIQAGTGNLQIQTQGGTLGIGNNAVAQTLTIGNTTGATAVTIQSGTGALNLQTQGTGGVNIATNAVAQTVTIGNTTGASAITIQGGTGAINIGTQAVADTITIGNSTGASSVIINDGTGALNIGTNAVAHTVSIGNATGATSVVVDCGTGACNFGTTATAHTTTVGSTNTTSATTVQSGSGGISLTGATTVTGTNTFTSGTGSVSLQGATTVSANLVVTNAGNVAFQKTASDYSTTGTSNNVNFGTGALVRLTGASAQTITGIAAGSNGQILTIVNAAGQAAIIQNLNAGSTAANQINTGTSGDVSLPAGASMHFVYDTGSSLWRVVGGVAATGGSAFVQLQASTPGTAQTGNFNIGTGTGIAGTFDSIASGTLNLGTTNASTINIGTNAVAHTIAIGNGAAVEGITIGSTNTTSSLLLQAGTGNLQIQTQGGTLGIGNNAVAQTLTIGNTTGATAVNVRVGTGNYTLDGVGGSTYTLGASTVAGTITIGGTGQTGNMVLGQSTATNSISIGASAGAANTQTINIGTSSTATSTTTLNIGSTIAGVTTLQSAGGVAVSTLGTANTVSYLCRNSSNIVASCQTNVTGSAFVQGGNTFGAPAVLGTNDANTLAFETNNNTKLIIDTSATTNFTLQQASNIVVASAATGAALTIQGGAATSGTNVGGNLILQGGAGASTGASGSVIVKSNTNNSTTAFQVQNTTGTAALTVDTTVNFVGVGTTTTPVANLEVHLNTSTANAALAITQAGTGDATISLASASQSWSLGVDASNSNAFSINASSSIPAATTPNLGYTGPGTTTGSSNQNQVLCTYITAPNDGTITSLSIYLADAPSPSPNNAYSLALYNTGGSSETLVGSATGTLSGSAGLNTLPVSFSVKGGNKYMVCANNNALDGTHSNWQYSSSPGSLMRYVPTWAYGNGWPSNFTGFGGFGSIFNVLYVMYATMSYNKSLVTVSSTGDTTFSTTSGSTTAFRIQNASGSSLLSADTVNKAITIRGGSSTYVDTGLTVSNFGSGWTTSGWNVTNPSLATHTVGNTTSLVNTGVAITAGATYEVTFKVQGICRFNGALVYAYIGGTFGASASDGSCTSAPGEQYSFIVTATSTAGLTFTPNTNFQGTISQVTIDQLSGVNNPILTLQGSDAPINTLEVRTVPGSSGQSGLFVGVSSGLNTIGGARNTAVGNYSEQYTLFANDNTALGYTALQNNVNGAGNTAVGSAALQGSGSGSQNVAIGQGALQGDVAGSYNTGVGNYTLGYIQHGSNNTGLGFDAGGCDVNNSFCSVDTQNSTAIGAYAQVQANNSIILGSVDTATKVGIGTTIPDNMLSVEPVFINDNTNTASQSTNTITGTGTTWVSSGVKVGMRFIFANGTDAGTITAVTSNTSLTVTTSQTVSAQNYRIHTVGFQVTSAGNAYVQNTSTTAFQVQNASGTNLLNADTSSMRVTVNSGNLDVTGISIAPQNVSVAASASTGGTLSGASAAAYYYQVSAVLSSGETIPSTEAVIHGYNFATLTPPGAPSLAATAGSGLSIGAYNYVVTFVNANGETTAGTVASVTTTSGNQKVNVTAIPLGPAGTTGRNIYRTAVGPLGTAALVRSLNDNTTTSFTDSLADNARGSYVPSINTATLTNTNQALVTWTAVSGATSYKIYRSTTSGAENAYFTSATNSYTDTGSAGTGGSPVSSDSTQRIGIGTLSPRTSLDVLGSAIIQTPVNSTSAFQIQSTSGAALLNADTANSTITLRAGVDTLNVGSNIYSGNFSAGWTGTAGWNVAGVTTAIHNTGNTTALVNTSVSITAGSTYEVDASFGGTCGSGSESVAVGIGGTISRYIYGSECDGQTTTFIVTATTTTGLTFTPSTNWSGTISGINIYPITGAATPVLSLQNSSGGTFLEVRPSADTYSTFIGLGSGQYDNGAHNDNTALGAYALQDNTWGYGNVAVGALALQINTQGWQNVAIGEGALSDNTTADNNIGIGYFALSNNSTGGSNIGIGTDALNSNTTGSNNYTLGGLAQNVTGSGNIAIGYGSLFYNTTGSQNMAIGYAAGYQDSGGNFKTSAALQNATAIGAYTQVQANNSIVLGSVDTVTKVGIGTTIPLNTFSVSPLDTQAGTASQAGTTTVTGSGTSWTTAMAGEQFIWADGNTGTIVSVNAGAQTLVLSASYTEAASTHYRIHHIGLQVTSSGNAYVQNTSTTAFQVQNSSGLSIATVDTTNQTLTLRAGSDTAVVGANLYSGNFSAGWTGTAGWNVSGVTTAVHNTGNTTALVNTSVAITIGTTYEVEFGVNGTCGTSSDFLNVSIGGASLGGFSGTECVHTFDYIATATSTTGLTFTPTTNWSGTISNISIVAFTSTVKPAFVIQNTSGSNSLEARASAYNSSMYIGTYSGQYDYQLTDNTGIGYSALSQNDLGYDNTAIGYSALTANTTGYYNTAIGSQALQANVIGTRNVAIGYQSLVGNETGNSNIAIGYAVMPSSDGSYNASLGGLGGNTTGSNNTALGIDSLWNNTTGSYNTAVGYLAGFKDSGNNFTTLTTLQNATAIGAYAQVQASNSIVLGSVDTATKVGIGTTIPDNAFSVSPYVVDDNTNNASQSGNTITGVSTTWLSNVKVGMRFIFANGTDAGTITAVGSNTSLTVSTSQTVSSQHYRIHNIGFQVTSAGNAYVQGSSTNTFQVQNAIAEPIFTVGTTSLDNNVAQLNYLTYSGFETGSFSSATSGWAIAGSGALTQTTSQFNVYQGSAAATVTISSFGNGGITTSSFVSTPPAGAYIVSWYAKLISGTAIGSAAFTVTSTDGAAHTCSPAAGVAAGTGGFQRFYCSFTATGNITALQIVTNDTQIRTFVIDAVQLQSTTYNGVPGLTTPTAYQPGQVKVLGAMTSPLSIVTTTNSVSAFQVQTTTNITTLQVDTLDNYVTLGSGASSAATLLLLGNKTDSGDPTEVDGAMYYNNVLEQFRCGRDGQWEPCGINPIDRGFEIEDEFFNGTTATSGAIGSLGWSPAIITTGDTFSYNSGTPAPSADHPGVLQMTTSNTASVGTNLELGAGSMGLAAGQVMKASAGVGAITNPSQILRVGMTTVPAATTRLATTGVWWEYDPAVSLTNWSYCYVNAGPTATCAQDSSLTVAANTFYRLEIAITATGAGTSSINFYLNGHLDSVSGVTLNTTNLVTPSLFCGTDATNANARTCFVDYYQLRGVASAAR